MAIAVLQVLSDFMSLMVEVELVIMVLIIGVIFLLYLAGALLEGFFVLLFWWEGFKMRAREKDKKEAPDQI